MSTCCIPVCRACVTHAQSFRGQGAGTDQFWPGRSPPWSQCHRRCPQIHTFSQYGLLTRHMDIGRRRKLQRTSPKYLPPEQLLTQAGLSWTALCFALLWAHQQTLDVTLQGLHSLCRYLRKPTDVFELCGLSSLWSKMPSTSAPSTKDLHPHLAAHGPSPPLQGLCCTPGMLTLHTLMPLHHKHTHLCLHMGTEPWGMGRASVLTVWGL